MPPIQPESVPMVCIGVSAGGLQPLQTIVKHLNPATGMAFVIVCHLTPTEPACLPWLLSLWSPMPADLARTGEIPKPNHICVIPPGREIILSHGHFNIQPRSIIRGSSNVVTLFLNSLIRTDKLDTEKTPCVTVILSGDNCDGTAFSQNPRSASHEDMPLSSIETGSVDYILAPEAIAARLQAIAHSLAA